MFRLQLFVFSPANAVSHVNGPAIQPASACRLAHHVNHAHARFRLVTLAILPDRTRRREYRPLIDLHELTICRDFAQPGRRPALSGTRRSSVGGKGGRAASLNTAMDRHRKWGYMDGRMEGRSTASALCTWQVGLLHQYESQTYRKTTDPVQRRNALPLAFAQHGWRCTTSNGLPLMRRCRITSLRSGQFEATDTTPPSALAVRYVARRAAIAAATDCGRQRRPSPSSRAAVRT